MGEDQQGYEHRPPQPTGTSEGGNGMSTSNPGAGETREALDRLLGELRPKLHRYCARMTGSVVDGEDVVQEALVKAIEAFSRTEVIAYPEGWVFRVAHNAALDFLRRRARQLAASLLSVLMFPTWAEPKNFTNISWACLVSANPYRSPGVQRQPVTSDAWHQMRTAS